MHKIALLLLCRFEALLLRPELDKSISGMREEGEECENPSLQLSNLN